MIGAFNRPNSNLLINIRQNVLQLVAVIRRVQHQQLQHMIYAYEVLYKGKSESPNVRVISWPLCVIKTYVM